MPLNLLINFSLQKFYWNPPSDMPCAQPPLRKICCSRVSITQTHKIEFSLWCPGEQPMFSYIFPFNVYSRHHFSSLDSSSVPVPRRRKKANNKLFHNKYKVVCFLCVSWCCSDVNYVVEQAKFSDVNLVCCSVAGEANKDRLFSGKKTMLPWEATRSC